MLHRNESGRGGCHRYPLIKVDACGQWTPFSLPFSKVSASQAGHDDVGFEGCSAIPEWQYG